MHLHLISISLESSRVREDLAGYYVRYNAHKILGFGPPSKKMAMKHWRERGSWLIDASQSQYVHPDIWNLTRDIKTTRQFEYIIAEVPKYKDGDRIVIFQTADLLCDKTAPKEASIFNLLVIGSASGPEEFQEFIKNGDDLLPSKCWYYSAFDNQKTNKLLATPIWRDKRGIDARSIRSYSE